MKVKNEESPIYGEPKNDDDEVIRRALEILTDRMRKPGEAMSSPETVKSYLRLEIAETEYEVFVVLFLDAQHRLISYEEMFRGTLTQTSVYPREVVKRALANNAAAVILAHNHPSGLATESGADRKITDQLKQALELVDVRVLDHFIVAPNAVMSFAESGII